MVNDIISSIILKLDTLFGEDSVIHRESIEQGFKSPCFFVKMLTTSHKLVLNNRYFFRHSFDIHYFPGDGKKNAEMYLAGDKLYNLEYISNGNDLIRGTGMRYEIIDDVLHFFVQYNYYAYLSKEEAEKMQSIDIK